MITEFTKATYFNGELQLDKKINQFRLEFEKQIYYISPNYVMSVMINQKGISIFYMKFLETYKYSVNKYYLNSVCDSKKIYLYPNKLETFPIEEIVFKGIDELYFSFVNVDKNIQIFKKNRLIKENEFFTDQNNFTYIFNIENPENKVDDIYYLYVKMKSGYICMIEVQIKIATIKFGSNEYKCLIDESYGRINNINQNNLNRNFIVGSNEHALEIYFRYINDLPKGNELKIYYENILIDCRPNIDDQYNVTCKIPDVILEFSKTKYIYSKLSCKNIINIGWIYYKDSYVKGVYDLMPKVLSIKELVEGKKYNPRENIFKFDINMINYYYWFGCLAYCDDNLIEDRSCCPEILQDKNWKVVFNKEYYMDIEEFINYIESIITLLKICSNKIVEWSFPEIEIVKLTIKEIIKLINKYLVSIYYYNFIILKSDKYKKIICAFPGTTNYMQLALEFILSFLNKIPNKNNENFKVSKMFYDAFETIEKDLINNLLLLSEINDPEYQTIFIGHSLGGVLATISAFYCLDRNIIKNFC